MRKLASQCSLSKSPIFCILNEYRLKSDKECQLRLLGYKYPGTRFDFREMLFNTINKKDVLFNDERILSEWTSS